jgi:hypothetical protein
MESEFITYRTFDDIVLANVLGEQLDKHHIEYIVEEEPQPFNGSSIFNTSFQKYGIKIKSDKFEQVNKLLTEDENANLGEVEESYYLFDFTETELMDLLSKADEWSAFDVALARKILTDRGKNIDERTIKTLTEKRLDELKAPEQPQTFWIILGYICAFLGGVLGIFIGWHLSSFKKTLPDGERIFEYSESDRRHGKRIFNISVVVAIIAFILKMLSIFSN